MGWFAWSPSHRSPAASPTRCAPPYRHRRAACVGDRDGGDALAAPMRSEFRTAGVGPVQVPHAGRPGYIPISASSVIAVFYPIPGSSGERPDLGIGPGAGRDLPLRCGDQLIQPRHRRQLLLSRPGPSRAAGVLAAQAVADERGVDPARYTRA